MIIQPGLTREKACEELFDYVQELFSSFTKVGYEQMKWVSPSLSYHMCDDLMCFIGVVKDGHLIEITVTEETVKFKHVFNESKGIIVEDEELGTLLKDTTLNNPTLVNEYVINLLMKLGHI